MSAETFPNFIPLQGVQRPCGKGPGQHHSSREALCLTLRRLDSSPSLTTDWMICSLRKFVTTCFLTDLTQTIKISKAMQSGHGSRELGNAHAESGPCRDPCPFGMQPFPLFCLEDSKWLHKEQVSPLPGNRTFLFGIDT